MADRSKPQPLRPSPLPGSYKPQPQDIAGIAVSAVWALFGAALWIVFVGGTRRDEMIAGAAILAPSMAFFYRVWRTEELELEFHWRDVAQGWRIPWYIVSGIYEIVVVFLIDVFGKKRSDSLFRVCGFKTAKSDPRLIARRMLATFYTTMAPNFIIIGIDIRQSRMLFHQLERSSVPRMTKALGAQPGAIRT